MLMGPSSRSLSSGPGGASVLAAAAGSPQGGRKLVRAEARPPESPPARPNSCRRSRELCAADTTSWRGRGPPVAACHGGGGPRRRPGPADQARPVLQRRVRAAAADRGRARGRAAGADEAEARPGAWACPAALPAHPERRRGRPWPRSTPAATRSAPPSPPRRPALAAASRCRRVDHRAERGDDGAGRRGVGAGRAGPPPREASRPASAAASRRPATTTISSPASGRAVPRGDLPPQRHVDDRAVGHPRRRP